MRVDTRVDERTLREIYLPAFERAVTAVRVVNVRVDWWKTDGALSESHLHTHTRATRRDSVWFRNHTYTHTYCVLNDDATFT